jgi:RNA polymerase sigma-70 factor (ECF subfamily)
MSKPLKGSMVDDPSVNLVARWRTGDQRAAAALYERYAGRLIALARSQLSAKVSHRVDPEDVVQSVYRSFFVESRDGRYGLERGGDLWRLLVTITFHKLRNQVKHGRRAKRDRDRERSFGSEDSLHGIGGPALTDAPSPIEAVALADELEQVMAQLKPAQRPILELRLQGYNIAEIAAQLHCGERTVRRVLEQVKDYLQQCRSQKTGR